MMLTFTRVDSITLESWWTLATCRLVILKSPLSTIYSQGTLQENQVSKYGSTLTDEMVGGGEAEALTMQAE